MHRLKTRPQFQAAMAGGTVSRTAHFALHRLGLEGTDAAETPAIPTPTGPGSLPQEQEPQALFGLCADQRPGPWMGAMVPKRWARRAVTRNAIKRQIYAVSTTFAAQLPVAAQVVRLRAGFDRKQFHSATSDLLKQAVREELQQLFGHAVRRAAPRAAPGVAAAAAAASPAPAAAHSPTPVPAAGRTGNGLEA